MIDGLYPLARHDGTCPYCCKFIRAGRSYIAHFGCDLPPDPKQVRWHARDQVWCGVHVQPMRSARARPWGHAACVEAFHTALDGQDPATIAADWRTQLREHKREQDREHKRGRPRRERRRAK